MGKEVGLEGKIRSLVLTMISSFNGMPMAAVIALMYL